MRWSQNMKIALITKNKLGFINGKYPKPDEKYANYNDWIRTDYTVMRWILNSLSDSISEGLSYVTSSRQLWEDLEERFNQSNAPFLYQLRKDVVQIHQGDAPVAEYYARLKSIWEDIRSLDPLAECECGVIATCTCELLKKIVARDNKNNLIDFLMGLDKKYESIRGQILAMEPLPSVNQTFAKLHQTEIQKHITNTESSADFDGLVMNAMHNSSSKSAIVPQWSTPKVPTPSKVWRQDAKKPRLDRAFYHCDFCNKHGHTREYCWKLKNSKSKSYHPSGSQRSFAHPEKKFAVNVEDISPFDADTPLDAVVDSTPTQQFASHPTPVDPTFVQAVAKELLKLQGNSSTLAGMAVLSSANTILSDFLVSDWIIDSGASDHMTNDFSHFLCSKPLVRPISVTLPDGQTQTVLFSGDIQLTDNILLKDVLYLPSFKHNLLSLGRLLTDSDLCANFTSDGCTIQARSSNEVLCTGSRHAGIYRFNASSVIRASSVSTTDCSNDVLLLHARLGHPSFSALKHVIPDVATTISYFIAYVANQFNTTIKVLRSDNGSEIVQDVSGSILNSNGIVHQKSIPGNPQQNGKVERKHRHLLEIDRALRIQAHLPKRFWGDMVLTATHLINLMPTSVLKWKTPHEMLFQTKPDYTHLRIVGCLCYAAHKSSDKLYNRAIKCVLLGYPFAQKGYRLYDIANQRVILSRDVLFQEKTFPFSSQVSAVRT
ncbi:hypothetical protein RND81_09G223100 [Saponaria officinalis]|uniref:Integrase catalytic domain-containing protein n=1 Tax=Saponaria officinalis TaxID=3572 RepID=A0AAW1IRN1_SAPOF